MFKLLPHFRHSFSLILYFLGSSHHHLTPPVLFHCDESSPFKGMTKSMHKYKRQHLNATPVTLGYNDFVKTKVVRFSAAGASESGIGVCLFVWAAALSAQRRPRESTDLQGRRHCVGGNLLFPQQLEKQTGKLHTQATATGMHQVNNTAVI